MSSKDANRLKRKLSQYSRGLLIEGKRVLDVEGLNMVNQAKRDHVYEHHSHNLERSTVRKIEGSTKKGFYKLSFFIDPRRVTVRSKDGSWNYGWIQHDGSAKGYKRSSISPKARPKGKGKGVKHDHFMERAWFKYLPKIRKGIEGNQRKLKSELGL
jgi:hypothetical protein